MRYLAILALLMSGPVSAAGCLGDMPAPDKSIVVTVRAVNQNHESAIEFRSADGRSLLKRSYASPDMEHGLVIAHCAWTPNSKFFVYSSHSSGGHEAWHFETTFYSTDRNQENEVDALVGAVTDPDFILQAPDVLHTIGWVDDKSLVHLLGKADGDEQERTSYEYETSLSALLKDAPLRRPKPAPKPN